jgi:small subunit ribosomal protein S17
MADVDEQQGQAGTAESAAATESAAASESVAASASVTAGRTVTGVVISDKGDKTITIRVERQVKHPIYGKYIRRSGKLRAHDENNECHVGDLVTVRASRPYSKSKAFVLASVDERATGV